MIRQNLNDLDSYAFRIKAGFFFPGEDGFSKIYGENWLKKGYWPEPYDAGYSLLPRFAITSLNFIFE